MGKHRKLPPLPAPSQPVAANSNLDLSESAARKALAALEAALDGDASPQTAREIGSLARALVTIEGERRAQQKARAYTAKTLPREVLFECLRSMTTDELNHVRREIDAMMNTDSVLG